MKIEFRNNLVEGLRGFFFTVCGAGNVMCSGSFRRETVILTYTCVVRQKVSGADSL